MFRAICSLQKRFLGMWFWVFVASIAVSYFTVRSVTVHSRKLPMIFLAAYPDSGDEYPLVVSINNGGIDFSTADPKSSTQSKKENIFISGITLSTCNEIMRGKSIDVKQTSDFRFTAAIESPVYQLKADQGATISCDASEEPISVGFTKRRVRVQLDSVVSLNSFADTEQKIGKPVRFAEIGFPITGISDFEIKIAGLPSEYKYPPVRDAASPRDAPLPLGPHAARLDAATQSFIAAEWENEDAKELRDILFLIIGVLLGVGGAALIEWLKFLGTGTKSPSSDPRFLIQ